MSTDRFVRVAPDSTGKKIRNLEITTVDPVTGAEHVVYMQVVSVVDQDGRALDLEGVAYLPLILEELRKVTFLLEALQS